MASTEAMRLFVKILEVMAMGFSGSSFRDDFNTS